MECTIDSIYHAGRNGFFSGNYNSVISHMDTLIEIYETYPIDTLSLMTTYHVRGSAYLANRELLKAQKDYKYVVQLNKRYPYSHEELALLYNDLSKSYNSYTEKDSSYHYADLAIYYAEEAFGKYHLKIVDYLMDHIGDRYAISDYESVSQMLTRAQEIADSNDQPHYSKLASMYNIQGVINKNSGKYYESLENYKSGLNILRYNDQDQSYTCALLYNNIGIVQKHLSEYDSASYNYTKSYEMISDLYGNNNFRLTTSLGNLANLHMLKNDFKKSIEYYDKAIAVIINSEGKEGYRYLNLFARREGAYHHFKRIGELAEQELFIDSLRQLVYGEKAMDVNYLRIKAKHYAFVEDHTKADSIYLLAIRNVSINKEEGVNISILHELNLYQSYGEYNTDRFIETKDTTYLYKANAVYDLVKTLLLKFKLDPEYQKSSFAVFQRFNTVINFAMSIAEQLYRIEVKSEYIDRIVFYGELRKSMVLSNKLNHLKGLEYAGVDGVVKKEGDKLLECISTLKLKIKNSKDDSLIVIYQSELENIEKKRFNWLVNIRDKYPHYYEYNYGYWDSNLRQLQSQLSSLDELVVNYTYADSSIYVSSYSHDNSYLRKIEDAQEVKLLIDSLNNMMIQNSSTRELSNELYQLLIQPELAKFGLQIDRLTICHDQDLSRLSFDLLFDGSEYLVAQYALRYIHNLNLKYDNLGQESKNIALFAPEYYANSISNNFYTSILRDGKLHLPGAEKEVLEIEKILSGDLFLKNKASKKNFATLAEDYNILHLSMHSVPDENGNAMLLFQSESNDSLSNTLSSEEIFEMNLNADLAVLSACNTGVGPYEFGEGVKSLSYAFTYSGVSATVMSLWKVPDNSTSQIMISFYRNLKAGYSKSLSLQLAKQDYLSNISSEEESHPFYWAGFVLIGNDDPLQSRSNALWYGFALLLAIGIGAIRYQRRGKSSLT